MNKAERKSLRVAAELLDRVVEILFELAGDEDGDERKRLVADALGSYRRPRKKPKY